MSLRFFLYFLIHGILRLVVCAGGTVAARALD